MQYTFIQSNAELEGHLIELSNAPYIAIDTEFTRVNTYYPVLSTLQICYKSGFALVIDAQSNVDLESVLDIIYDDKIIKIFHGSEQDLELLLGIRGTIPKNIFDTQIVVMVLNFPKNISYEKLVESLLNIKINKTLKTSDWLARPLSAQQLEYGAFDVLYLYDCYELLIKKLTNKGRLLWCKELMEKIENKDFFSYGLKSQINKITQDIKFNNPTYIYNVLEWRETLAKKNNVIRSTILSRDSVQKILLTNITTKQELVDVIVKHVLEPSNNKYYQNKSFNNIDLLRDLRLYNNEQLYKTDTLNTNNETVNITLHLTNREIDALFNIIVNNQHNTEVVNTDETENLHDQLSRVQKQLLSILHILMLNYAMFNNVHDTLLASKDDITDLITYHSDETKLSSLALMNTWRYDIFGKVALEFIKGEKTLVVKDRFIMLQ